MLYNSLYIACYITEQLLSLLYNSYKTVIYDSYITCYITVIGCHITCYITVSYIVI